MSTGDGSSGDRLGHSQRKAQVLDLLDGCECATTEEIADAVGCSESNIRSVVSRLHRQGMIESEGGGFVPGKGTQAAEYAIVGEGIRILRHYRETKDIPEYVSI